MISIEDYIQDLAELKADLKTDLPIVCQRIAADAYALIKTRIRETGRNATGISFGQYSDHPLNPKVFEGKELNGGGLAALQKARRSGKGISYKAFRAANGLENKFVNISFTNQTLNDVGVVNTVDEDGKITAFVGPENQIMHDGKSTDALLQDLEVKYGEIIDVNPEEEKEIELSLEDELEKIVQNRLT